MVGTCLIEENVSVQLWLVKWQYLAPSSVYALLVFEESVKNLSLAEYLTKELLFTSIVEMEKEFLLELGAEFGLLFLGDFPRGVFDLESAADAVPDLLFFMKKISSNYLLRR